ncbi:DUF3352 domain-containing protein [Candidatus Peregrinibacteria bacterium]|nr:DUF3352 domain-containing protein [Candidatus Peregrinibacteria bacterium]
MHKESALKFIIKHQEILTPIFAAIAMILAGAIMFSAWIFILRPEPIGNFLPLQNTAAYFEISIDSQNPQVIEFLKMTRGHPFFAKERLIQQVKDFTQMDFDENIAPWLGNNIGLGLVVLENQSLRTEPIVFIENKSRDKTKEFLQKLAIKFKNDYLQENEYKNHEIYSYRFSQDFAFSFMGRYLVAAQTIKSMEKFIDAISENFTPISSNRNYFDLNLSDGYINLPLLSQVLTGNSALPETQRYFFLAFEPFIRIFKHSFIQLEAKSGYLSLKTTTLLQSKFEKNNKKYTASLAQYFPSNIKLFYGGMDLSRQLDNYGRMIGEDGAQFKKSIKEITDSNLGKLFGSAITFEKDIYPLLTEEYAIGVTAEDDMFAALKLKDPAAIEQKLKTMMIFLKKSPGFANTEKQILQFEESHRSFNIFGLKQEGAASGIYYSIVNGAALMSSSEKAIQNAIDVFLDGKNGFLASALIKNADEIFYIAADKYFETLSRFSEYLKPIKAVIAARNYDEFYVKTIYYILVE